MRRITKIAAACVGLGWLQSAAADHLRCGDALIEPGDAATYVLENCFAPPQPGADAGAYQVSLPQLQRWRIVRGPGQFDAVVVIGADGRVETIEFDTRRN
jgi:Protein of unknown function (DUF2845)